MRVDVRVIGESLFHFLFFQGHFFRIIAGHGMPRMILHVKTAARNEVVVEFLLVFDRLDAEKDSAEAKGGDQENTDKLLLANLRGPHRHCHRQAAHDEHDRVEAAKLDIERVAADAEGGAERTAIDGVREEQAAEEQDFGDQENPHAKRGGILLLLERLKLFVQIAGAWQTVFLSLSQCMAWLEPRTGGTEVRPYS